MTRHILRHADAIAAALGLLIALVGIVLSLEYIR